MSDVQQTAPRSRIQSNEWYGAAISFVYFFCVLCAYYVMRPVREQFAAAVGSTNLPWFYFATFIATLVLTPIFAWLSAHYARRIVVPLVYGFFIVCLIGFIPLFTQQGILNPKELGTAFFVWVSVFNLFVVSVFWIFMTDLWTPEQARRLFPVIGAGGAIGTLVGPLLTQMLVEKIGVAMLLAVSALLLCVAVGCILALIHWSHKISSAATRAKHAAGVGGGMFDGLKQIFSNPFVAGMALLLLLGDGIGTINYALVADYSGHTFTDKVARTAFAAKNDLITNTVQIVVQLLMTRLLLVRWGVVAPVLLWALVVILSMGSVVMVADPNAAVSGLSAQTLSALHADVDSWWDSMRVYFLQMPWVVFALIMSRACGYGLLGPAREAMFAAVPRNLRYQGKNAVDTAVWRFGDLVISTSINLLRSAGVATGGFAQIAVVSAAAAGWLGWRLGRRVEQTAHD